MKRREFIKGALVGSAALAGGIPLTSCGNDVSPAPEIPGSFDDDPASATYGEVAVDLTAHPELDDIGAAVTVRLTPPTDGRARPFRVPAGILFIHRGAPADPPEYAALESTCTHAACPLGYNPHDQLVECPCHASRFRAAADPGLPGSCAGDVVHRPARQGPTAFEVQLSGKTAYILLSSIVGCKLLPPLVDGKVTITLADAPDLAQPGGSIVGTPQGFSDPLAVVRVDQSTVVALNARCTHLGCTVAYDRSNNDLQCPCHQSSFALDGTVQRDPATRNLTVYPVTFDGSTVVITLL